MIVPAVGSTSRLIILSVVVLPHPDGPTSATISPSAMSSVRSVTAGLTVPSNCLCTSTREIAVEPLAPLISGNLSGMRRPELNRCRQTELRASITARQRSGSDLYGA